MYSLSPPSRDGLIDFESILAQRNSKARVLLESMYGKIARAYCDYNRLSGNGVLIEPLLFNSQETHVLKTNFASLGRGRSHSHIRDEILSSAYLDLCPYCSVATVESLDHYLPQSVYPEFAVLAQNIVPSCSRCNRIKDNTCFNTSGKNLAHLYYVEIPRDPILHACVAIEKQSVTWKYYLENNGTIDDAIFQSIENLFTILSLADLYGQHSAIEMIPMVEYLDELFQRGGAVWLREYLQAMAKSARIRQGANYWKTALLKSLAESKEFCDGGYQQLRSVRSSRVLGKAG